jgi:hypothetical protein
VAIPLLFLAALSFSAIGLYFTAIIPSIDHMSLPFFLVIMPIGFASSTYFPLPNVPGCRLPPRGKPRSGRRSGYW